MDLPGFERFDLSECGLTKAAYRRGTGPAVLLIKEGFGERFRAVEVQGKGHSVFTYHFDRLSEADQARVWKELLDFLAARLGRS